jgi:hypothetical protein
LSVDIPNAIFDSFGYASISRQCRTTCAATVSNLSEGYAWIGSYISVITRATRPREIFEGLFESDITDYLVRGLSHEPHHPVSDATGHWRTKAAIL